MDKSTLVNSDSNYSRVLLDLFRGLRQEEIVKIFSGLVKEEK